ncbi:MAG: MraZ N-terminal domain-containing protein [Candidatus Micrarchaeota archaeon]
MEMDAKGRVLIPAAWRKDLGLRGRVQAEKKKSSLVLRGYSEQNFFIKYAGFVGKKYKIKPMTAEEFDDTVDKAMLAEAGRKFK